MARAQVSDDAERDLLSIWRYLADYGPASATRLIHSFYEQFALLSEHPRLGQARPDIRADLRHFPVKRYVILYRVIPDGVEIVRVVHGSRDLGALFEPEDSDDPPATT
jgi:toxin ParE1/3/4